MQQYAGKPRKRVRLPTWLWHLIERRKAEAATPSMVARETKLSRDVICAVFAGVPAVTRWRVCPACSRENDHRKRTCEKCGQRMAKTNLAGGESFVVSATIAEARRFVDVVRFTEGELAIPEGSKLRVVTVWSGPSQCLDYRQFSPKYEDGRPVLIEVQAGQSVTLPAAFFKGHAVALVGDVSSPITLRMRG